MAPDTQGKRTLSFSIGTMGRTMKTDLAAASITVCGKEVVTAKDPAAVARTTRADAADEIITKATYAAWFTLTAGADSSPECTKDTKYELVDEAGAALEASDALVRLKPDGGLEITSSALAQAKRTVQLQATSRGGVSARRKLEL